MVEARAIFQAGELAEQRVDWRAAYAHYTRAARLQPSDWQIVQHAGNLARRWRLRHRHFLNEAALKIVTSVLGQDAPETATALDNLALTYESLARYAEAELLPAGDPDRRNELGKDHPNVATRYNNLANLLHAQGKYAEAEPLYRRAS